jgi:hypothetical protein
VYLIFDRRNFVKFLREDNMKSKTTRFIADNGLPLKIQAEWTDNDYYNRRHPDLDELECVNVAGWLIRINGKKYPRGNYDEHDELDWTYRYTPSEGQTSLGKWIAIGRALTSAGLKTEEPKDVIRENQIRLFTWAEKQTMREGFAT